MTLSLLPQSIHDILQRANILYVGFSGGLDSTVLLHVLSSNAKLKTKLQAIHFNHGFSQFSQEWEDHCKAFCHRFSLPIQCEALSFDSSRNFEANARKARNLYYEGLLEEKDILLLGHHKYDQAETLLLNLFRGAGIDGLAAIPEIKTLAKGKVIRPLLNFSKEELLQYANENKLTWVEDESNKDVQFSRNYIRNSIIPMIEKRWPSAVSNMARTAIHCQKSSQLLNKLADDDMPEQLSDSNVLPLDDLRYLQKDRIYNLLRHWIKSQGVTVPSAQVLQKLHEELILTREDAEPSLILNDLQFRRFRNHLYLLPKFLPSPPLEFNWEVFPNQLILGDGLGVIQANKTDKGILIPPKSNLKIRFRQGGETIYWHGQTKSLKKLFQDWHIPPWERKLIPLLYINDVLVSVIGYAVSDKYFSLNASECWSIERK